MKEQGIGGISYWKIGLPFPQNWRLLVENFIEKGLTKVSPFCTFC